MGPLTLSKQSGKYRGYTLRTFGHRFQDHRIGRFAEGELFSVQVALLGHPAQRGQVKRRPNRGYYGDETLAH